MLVEPLDPEWQPAMPGFERADPQSRIAVHDAAADQRGHVAHAAPGMRRRTLQPEIVPGVLAAGRIRRHHGKSMQYDREVEFGRRGVEGFEFGIVERHADRRIHHHPPGPTLMRAAADLAERSLDIAGTGEDHAAEPLWEGSAVIAHPAV